MRLIMQKEGIAVTEVASADSRGVCLHVDLSAIANNARCLKRAMGEDVRMMAVVKADAYGHGLVPVSRTALANGASFLGVALPEEGMRLRATGIDAPVLVLSGTGEEGAMISAREGLTQTVYDAAGVERLQRACERLGAQADVHLKVDTGMNRIGARDEAEVKRVLAALKCAPCVHLTGAFTHFADADCDDEAFSRQQFARFMDMAALLPPGLLLHAAASDAALRFSWARLNMVRAGVALYGCPSVKTALPLRPAQRLEARVTCVKQIHRGDTVGYGRSFCASHDMRVATLPVGYGDGYMRACSNRAQVLLHGQRCPVVGRVCMDQMMVDVTQISDVREGDTAVLLGTQGNECILPQQLAQWAGTICYEIMLSSRARVPVVYDEESLKGQ